jgi:hypothetical protein
MNTNHYSAASCLPDMVAEAAIKELQLKMDAVEMWVKTSRLVLYSHAVKHEIEVHKWCESEKAGHDIGWEQAAASWHMHYGHLP